MNAKRLQYIDVLKAIAIIAVVLYHAGFRHFGYLGVDVFLVVNGYLLANSFNRIDTIRGGYNFLKKRVLRLLPVMLVAVALCLVWGFFWMLPDSYEGVAQDVIATNLFANNILMSIKSADYWAVKNDFIPLMHTWYLGIVVQFYVVFTIILVLVKKIFKDRGNATLCLAGICFLVSIVLYLLPFFRTTAKFYFLPFRMFEFCAGICLALLLKDKQLKIFEMKGFMTILVIIAYLLVLALLFLNVEFPSAMVKLLLVVLLTCVLLSCLPYAGNTCNALFSNSWAAAIGKCSFSIYVWHQVVFAFCRYSFTSDFRLSVFLLLLLITAVLSWLTYHFVEENVSAWIKEPKKQKRLVIGTLSAWAVLTGVSLYLYSIAGVVRDVPELDTYKGKAFRGMHIAYCDRVYKMDKDFEDESKQHWLVVGTSYGRDFTNILMESDIDDEVELSYIYTSKTALSERVERLRNADMIYFTITENKLAHDCEILDKQLSKSLAFCDSIGIPDERIRIVGSKIFGVSCGQVYARRNKDDYYISTVPIDERFIEHNVFFKNKYDGKFIDLMTPTIVSENNVRVFSDDKKIISQDCMHLTKGGAQYYARLLKPLIGREIEFCVNLKE